jgi:hypothetical protein
MRKFYQTEWQNISFSSFHSVSSTKLAGPEFYDSFYRALFDKYSGYDALDLNWRRNKGEIADWQVALLPDCARVLSIGCGLGYMEQYLWRLHGTRVEIHVQDYASQAMQWLSKVLPDDRIHAVGEDIGQFDLIYLSAVDYAMSDNDLITLFKKARKSLQLGGQLVIVSASFLEESSYQKVIRNCKDAVKWFLDAAGTRPYGQFLGWMRSMQDYRVIMSQVGLLSVTDGFVETPHRHTYWIKGVV